MADISGIRIGDNHIELKPKGILMIVGVGCILIAFFNENLSFNNQLSLVILGLLFVILAGDYYKELQ